MNEEEIIKKIKLKIGKIKQNYSDDYYFSYYWTKDDVKNVEKALNLYKHEKEKNKKLEDEAILLRKTHNYDVKMIDEVKGEAVELYRVIDMIAEDISKFDIDELICKNSITGENDIGECDITCEECIKQYYFKKARGEENEKS